MVIVRGSMKAMPTGWQGCWRARSGQLNATGWRDRLDTALNNCQFARGDRPAVTRCRVVTTAATTLAHAARCCGCWPDQQAPGRHAPVDAGAEVLRGSTAPIDAEAVARWADGGGTGPMHRLLFDPPARLSQRTAA
jgi:hypothetical protein